MTVVPRSRPNRWAPQQATVYSFFNGEGEPLYVGCTTRTYVRFGDHGREDWFTEVARIEVEHFEDRQDAAQRERALIRELRPAHNYLYAKVMPNGDLVEVEAA